MNDHFAAMPARCGEPTGGAVLACLADTLGYRYYWATEGLPEAALTFRPSEESMDLAELLAHLRDLAWWIRATLTSDRPDRSNADCVTLRKTTLAWLQDVSEALAPMDTDALAGIEIRRAKGADPLPLWNMIHGPLCDFLTHVGQVNSWRRMAGHPPHGPRVFQGHPPRPESKGDTRHL